MSQRPSPSDPFLPFDPVAGAPARPQAPPPIRVVPRQEASPPFKPMDPRSGHVGANEGPGKPTVTLQRDGDRVTGIRVECTCGQVIELACVDGSNPVAP